MKKAISVFSAAAILLVLCLFASCGKTQVLKTPENVRIESGALVWDRVSGASGYAVETEIGKETVVTEEMFDLFSLEKGKVYRLRVKAKGDAKKFFDSALSGFVEYAAPAEKLAAPINVSVSGVTISWTASANAASYVIVSEGASGDVTVATVSQTSYALSNAKLLPGAAHTLKVKAHNPAAAFSDSDFSAPVVYNAPKARLTAPLGLSVSGGEFSWSAVPNAIGYTVSVREKSSSEPSVEEQTAELFFPLAGLSKAGAEYILRVKARGNGENYTDSDFSAEESYLHKARLSRPEGLLEEDGILRWTAVSNADGYMVYRNGVLLLETAEPELDLAGRYTPGGTLRFSVTAVSSLDYYLNSEPSEEFVKTFPKETLAVPENVRIEGNALSWDRVPNASGYTVKVNGTERTGIAEISLSLASYNNPGTTYAFSVKAVGNGTNYLDSGYSGQLEKAVPKAVLAPPVLSRSGATMIIWNAVPNASGYSVRVNGGEPQQQTHLDFSISSFNMPGVSYEIMVRAVGNVTNYEDSPWSVPYVHSLPPAELSAPGGLNVENSILSWSAVEHAESYTLDINGAVFQEITANSFSLAGFDEPGKTYRMSVRAVGNGTNYTDSPFSAEYSVSVKKIVLETPTELRISEDRLTLSWLSVQYAESYIVKTGTSERPVAVASFSLAGYDTPGQSYEFSVKAVASGTRHEDSPFSEPITLDVPKKQLSAPENVRLSVDGGTLSWDAAAHASGYMVSVVYGDADDRLQVIPVITSLDVSAYKLPGETYSFRVMASGDGASYLDSGFSAAAAKTLPTQTLAVPENPRTQTSDSTFRWNAVPNAAAYAVSVEMTDPGSGETDQNEYFVTSNVFSLSNCNAPGARYALSVKAAGNVSNYTDSGFTPPILWEVDARALPQPVPRKTGDELVWNAVPYAVGYVVLIDGAEIPVPETYFSLAVYNSPGETYTAQVRAVGNEVNYTDSLYSVSVIFTVPAKKLATPGNFTIEDGEIGWDAVENASGYQLSMHDGAREYLTAYSADTFSASLSNFNAPGTAYTFKVMARGNGKNYTNSDYSAPITHSVPAAQLPAPGNPRVAGAYFVWETVPGAEGYIFAENGTERPVQTSTSVSLSGLNVLGASYELTVKAVGNNKNYVDSVFTEPVAYIYTVALSMPTGLTLSGTTLSWSRVVNASGYEIIADGTTVLSLPAGASAPAIDISAALSEPGRRYIVQVAATGDGVSYQNSPISAAVVYTAPKKALSAPENLALAENVLSWDPVPNAIGYVVSEQGAARPMVTGTSYTFIRGSGPGMTYNYAVKAVGNGTNYTDSPYSAPVSYTVDKAKLATPKNLIASSAGVAWDAVSGATGYAVYVDNVFAGNTAANYFAMSSYNEPQREYEVHVVALGAAASHVASDASAVCVYTAPAKMLAVPANVRIENEGSTLSWGDVFDALGYRVKCGDTVLPDVFGPGDLFFDISGYNFPGTTYSFAVMAIGDGTIFGDSPYSNYIRKEVPRKVLSVPENLRIERDGENKYLRWDPAADATEYVVQVVFGVESRTLFVAAAECDISAYGTYGTTYRYTVAARADPKNFIQSAESTPYADEIPRMQLTAPSFTSVVDGYLSWTEVPDAAAYVIYVDGVEKWRRSATNVYIGGLNEPARTYIFTIQAVATGKYQSYTDSEISAGFPVTVPPQIASPSNIRVAGIYLRWDENVYASGYTVTYQEPGGTKREYTAETNELLMDMFTRAGKYDLTITADPKPGYERSVPASYTYENENSLYTISVVDGVYATLTAYNGAFGFASESLPDRIDGYTVTAIGAYAFKNATNLVSLTLPNSVLTIGSGAFASCTSLVEMTVPGSVRISEVFESVSKCVVRRVYLTSACGYIADYAFRDAGTLEEIVMPAAIRTIGTEAFSGCKLLNGITFLPPSGGGAPEGLLEIGDRAFSGCFSLIRFELPATCAFIGARAFEDASNLEQFVFLRTAGARDIEIGEYAFLSCKNLQDQGGGIIPGTVKKLGRGALDDTAWYAALPTPAEVYAGGFLYGFKGTMPLGHRIGALREGTYGIVDYAFSGQARLSAIDMRLSVITEIGESAFENCSLLKDLYLSPDLRVIGRRAFYGCTTLETVTIPAGMERIESRAFEGCTHLSKILSGTDERDGIPDTLLDLGVDVFSNTAWLRAKMETSSGPIALGKVLYLYKGDFGPADFAGTSYTVESGYRAIAGGAFRGKQYLEEIIIHDGVTVIGEQAFANCPALRSAVMPAYLERVESGMFASCAALASVTLGASVKYIGDNAFDGCSTLSAISLSDGLLEIGNRAFAQCISLVFLDIGAGVRTIGEYAFMNCTNVGSVVIPFSTVYIGAFAFSGWTEEQVVFLRAYSEAAVSWDRYWSESSLAREIWGY